MSTGYSDRPVARAIKIKHAGLNLTGPALRRRVSSAIALELVRRKQQAASLTGKLGWYRMNLERKNYDYRKRI